MAKRKVYKLKQSKEGIDGRKIFELEDVSE